MFKNYLMVALRNILRHKGHSLINIAGLSIGIACCLLLFLWVQDELSYDRYHENAERIYRVIQQWEAEGKTDYSATTPAPLAPALLNDFPEIQKTVRFAKAKYFVKYQEKRFSEPIVFADPQVFEMFTFPLVKGNPETALKDPNSILISQDMQKKYFGTENPLGKIITLDAKQDFKITGVFKNIPRNSHFRFDFLASFLIYRPDYWSQWGVSNFLTYILVSENFSLENFNEKMPQFVEKYRGKEVRDKYKIAYPLQPLTRIHLHSHLKNEIEPNRDINTVYIFSAIALFILMIACLNYINLATARFSNRAREVGLRKVLGATSPQLIKQFLGESILFALVALPLALLLAEAFLPAFNSLSGKFLAFHYFNNILLLAVLVGIILVVGLVSGIVPALFISAFQAMTALRGMLKVSPIIAIIRRSLVVFQFSISIVFIVCTLIISEQLQYTKTKDLGLNKENIINVHLQYNETALQKYKTLKHEFSRHADVISVSVSNFFPGPPRWYMNYWHEDMVEYGYPAMRCLPVDFDFFQTFQVKILEGRGFSRDFPTDEKNAFILNEAAVKEFDWEPASAVGKKFNVSNGWKSGTVIGVAQDFNFDSLHKKVLPLVLYIEPSGYDFISLRIKPGNIPKLLKFLKDKWQELVPGQEFVYSFLDDDFNRLYRTEFRLQKIFMIVTFLTLFIACLGLLGLAAFTSEQRTKEIGIRKVMGASITGIVLLLSKEFTRWVLVANIFAWPIAWYAMHQWLQDFAFRTYIKIWAFLLAGFIVLVVALLTLSYKTIKAASANPVETLRYE